MGIPDTYSEAPGYPPVWVETLGDASGPKGMRVDNTFRVADEMDSTTLTMLSEVVGAYAPDAKTRVAVRISYSDTRKLRDQLDAILEKARLRGCEGA